MGRGSLKRDRAREELSRSLTKGRKNITHANGRSGKDPTRYARLPARQQWQQRLTVTTLRRLSVAPDARPVGRRNSGKQVNYLIQHKRKAAGDRLKALLLEHLKNVILPYSWKVSGGYRLPSGTLYFLNRQESWDLRDALASGNLVAVRNRNGSGALYSARQKKAQRIGFMGESATARSSTPSTAEASGAESEEGQDEDEFCDADRQEFQNTNNVFYQPPPPMTLKEAYAEFAEALQAASQLKEDVMIELLVSWAEQLRLKWAYARSRASRPKGDGQQEAFRIVQELEESSDVDANGHQAQQYSGETCEERGQTEVQHGGSYPEEHLSDWLKRILATRNSSIFFYITPAVLRRIIPRIQIVLPHNPSAAFFRNGLDGAQIRRLGIETCPFSPNVMGVWNNPKWSSLLISLFGEEEVEGRACCRNCTDESQHKRYAHCIFWEEGGFTRCSNCTFLGLKCSKPPHKSSLSFLEDSGSEKEVEDEAPIDAPSNLQKWLHRQIQWRNNPIFRHISRLTLRLLATKIQMFLPENPSAVFFRKGLTKGQIEQLGVETNVLPYESLADWNQSKWNSLSIALFGQKVTGEEACDLCVREGSGNRYVGCMRWDEGGYSKCSNCTYGGRKCPRAATRHSHPCPENGRVDHVEAVYSESEVGDATSSDVDDSDHLQSPIQSPSSMDSTIAPEFAHGITPHRLKDLGIELEEEFQSLDIVPWNKLRYDAVGVALRGEVMAGNHRCFGCCIRQLGPDGVWVQHMKCIKWEGGKSKKCSNCIWKGLDCTWSREKGSESLVRVKEEIKREMKEELFEEVNLGSEHPGRDMRIETLMGKDDTNFPEAMDCEVITHDPAMQPEEAEISFEPLAISEQATTDPLVETDSDATIQQQQITETPLVLHLDESVQQQKITQDPLVIATGNPHFPAMNGNRVISLLDSAGLRAGELEQLGVKLNPLPAHLEDIPWDTQKWKSLNVALLGREIHGTERCQNCKSEHTGRYGCCMVRQDVASGNCANCIWSGIDCQWQTSDDEEHMDLGSPALVAGLQCNRSNELDTVVDAETQNTVQDHVEATDLDSNQGQGQSSSLVTIERRSSSTGTGLTVSSNVDDAETQNTVQDQVEDTDLDPNQGQEHSSSLLSLERSSSTGTGLTAPSKYKKYKKLPGRPLCPSLIRRLSRKMDCPADRHDPFYRRGLSFSQLRDLGVKVKPASISSCIRLSEAGAERVWRDNHWRSVAIALNGQEQIGAARCQRCRDGRSTHYECCISWKEEDFQSCSSCTWAQVACIWTTPNVDAPDGAARVIPIASEDYILAHSDNNSEEHQKWIQEHSGLQDFLVTFRTIERLQEKLGPLPTSPTDAFYRWGLTEDQLSNLNIPSLRRLPLGVIRATWNGARWRALAVALHGKERTGDDRCLACRQGENVRFEKCIKLEGGAYGSARCANCHWFHSRCIWGSEIELQTWRWKAEGVSKYGTEAAQPCGRCASKTDGKNLKYAKCMQWKENGTESCSNCLFLGNAECIWPVIDQEDSLSRIDDSDQPSLAENGSSNIRSETEVIASPPIVQPTSLTTQHDRAGPSPLAASVAIPVAVHAPELIAPLSSSQKLFNSIRDMASKSPTTHSQGISLQGLQVLGIPIRPLPDEEEQESWNNAKWTSVEVALRGQSVLGDERCFCCKFVAGGRFLQCVRWVEGGVEDCASCLWGALECAWPPAWAGGRQAVEAEARLVVPVSSVGLELETSKGLMGFQG